MLAYVDPPYVLAGDRLYSKAFGEADHRELAEYLTGECPYRWLLSYDNHPWIRELYNAPGVTISTPEHVWTGRRHLAGQGLVGSGQELLITRTGPAAVQALAA